MTTVFQFWDLSSLWHRHHREMLVYCLVCKGGRSQMHLWWFFWSMTVRSTNAAHLSTFTANKYTKYRMQYRQVQISALLWFTFTWFSYTSYTEFGSVATVSFGNGRFCFGVKVIDYREWFSCNSNSHLIDNNINGKLIAMITMITIYTYIESCSMMSDSW